jgi:hypothetical protein
LMDSCHVLLMTFGRLRFGLNERPHTTTPVPLGTGVW